MGSCISPIIANIYVEHIEHIAINYYFSHSIFSVAEICERHILASSTKNTSPHFILILTLSVLVFSLAWKTKKTPLSPFLTFWSLVKLAMRVTLLIYHSPLLFTKSLLTLIDIRTIHHSIPNTRSSLWSKHYLIASTHTSPTTNLSTVSNTHTLYITTERVSY